MTYDLIFKEDALKEWRKLDSSLQDQFKKKLSERRECPRVKSAQLKGMKNCYRIPRKASPNRTVIQATNP